MSALDEAIAARAAKDNTPLTPDETHVSCAAEGCSEHHHAKRVRATAVRAQVATELLAALVDLLDCDVEISGPDARECLRAAREARAKAEGKS